MSLLRNRQRRSFDLNSAMMGRMRLAIASLAYCLIVASAQAQQPPQREFRGAGPTPPAQVEPPAASARPPAPGRGSSTPSAAGSAIQKRRSIPRSAAPRRRSEPSAVRPEDAAGSVAAVPGTRVVTGRQLCPPAPNGAPDCQQGVDALCRTKGFQGGRTMDVTSAHRCSAKNLIAGRASKEGPCRLDHLRDARRLPVDIQTNPPAPAH